MTLVLGTCTDPAHTTRATCEAASEEWAVTAVGYLMELDVSPVEDAIVIIVGVGVTMAFARAGFRLAREWISRISDPVDGRMR